MYFHWIVLTFLVISAGILSHVQYQDVVTSEQASIDALSRSLLVYRSAAAEYARLNPAFTGTPNDAALSFPAWYHKPAGLHASILGGATYTYYSTPTPGLAAALLERTESVSIGVSKAGVLVSLKAGTTNISLPAVVPEGAIVVVN
ncbi:pilM protein [Pseudomonas sp. PA15(2017)]|uniref:type IV pilus biogenesis protein PilM n=1 Tax=Pseudomonas sp. PA15(2017) TaxID=1932111 RepID=UPI00095E7284|nr:type IV pilus biogenesis protein PilM [Pseudomonas sp. PA15(2017)]OLU25498.1 pilM protein [Pseudomonas sp. PA15(2017)]